MHWHSKQQGILIIYALICTHETHIFRAKLTEMPVEAQRNMLGVAHFKLITDRFADDDGIQPCLRPKQFHPWLLACLQMQHQGV